MNQRQGNLENTILNALWHLEENGQELSDVSEIQKRINSKSQQWAYTTVKTVLDRLVEKDLIERVKEGKKYLYKSTISRKVAGEAAIKKLARQYFNDDIDNLYKAVDKLRSEVFVYVR